MFSTRIPKIKGTKKFFGKNQPVISLGLPSLDAILGKFKKFISLYASMRSMRRFIFVYYNIFQVVDYLLEAPCYLVRKLFFYSSITFFRL